MQSTCVPTITKEGDSDFIDHVLNRFSHWSVDVGYILNMLEISGNENERLDVIEDCLREFGKLEIEPEEYPWQNISDGYSTFSPNASITLECRILLNELDEIPLRVKGDTVYGK